MDTEYPQIESGDRILPEISDGWFHILEKRDAILLMVPIVMFSTVILNKRSRAILTSIGASAFIGTVTFIPTYMLRLCALAVFMAMALQVGDVIQIVFVKHWILFLNNAL